MSSRLVSLALLTSVALLGAGCGEEAVSSADIEAKITKDITKQVAKPKAVDCPEEGLAATVGSQVICVLTAPNGDRLDVIVRAEAVKDGTVSYSYKVGKKVN